MAKNVNEQIMRMGTIVGATKLPVITIGIGEVSKLKDLPKTIWHNDKGEVVIATKEAPDGCIYDQSRIAVVRVIGGKVLINGLYDIYAPDPSKIEKLLSNNPFELLGEPGMPGNLSSEEDLKAFNAILNVASEVRPSIAPAEPGRKVIVITEDMVGENGYIECHCPWDPEDVLTKLYVGDIFLVEDEATCKGYRIGKEEFEGTHKLEAEH